jgi:hypothetical protein
MSSVVYLEQSESLRALIPMILKAHKVKAIESLEELTDLLGQNRADYYLIGGMFTLAKADDWLKASYLAPEAIDAVRERYQDSAIILLCNHDKAVATATDKGVQYINLDDNLVTRLKEAVK